VRGSSEGKCFAAPAPFFFSPKACTRFQRSYPSTVPFYRALLTDLTLAIYNRASTPVVP